jgi:hypothetical protein
MPRNKNSDLRNLLFQTIEQLIDGDLSVEQAQAVASVAKEINNSARNELTYMALQNKTEGEAASDFLTPKQLSDGK